MAFQDYSKGFIDTSAQEADEDALQRRKRLLEAMQAQNMQTPIQGKYGLAQALMKIGTTWLQKGTAEKQAGEEKSVKAAQADNLLKNFQAYTAMRDGRPGQTMSDSQAEQLLLNDVDPKLQEAVKPDPQQAIFRALASRSPELAAMAKADMDRQAQLGGFKDHIVDKTLVRVPNAGGAPQTIFQGQSDSWGAPETIQGPSGPLLVIRNSRTGETKPVDRTPKVNVSNNIGGEGSTEAAKALGKQVPEVLKTSQENFIKGQQILEDSQRLMELAKSPDLISGFGAGPVAGLASIGAKLGFTGPESVSQTQATLAALANNTLAQVKRLPGAITEKERPFLEMAASGKLEWTPETLQYLAGLAQATAHNEILQAHKQYRGAAALPGAEAGAAMFPIPALQHGLDPELFEDRGDGRVRYKGLLPGVKPAPAAAEDPTKKKRFTTSGW